MKPIKSFLLFFFIFSIIVDAGSGVINKNGKKYLSGSLIVKFKNSEHVESFSVNSLSKVSANVLNKLGAEGVTAVFTPTANVNRAEGELLKIGRLSYSSPIDPQYFASKVSRLSEVEWAEPEYVYDLAFEPNDIKYKDGTQWYLNKIKAAQAWDVSKGNEEIIIGIVDTGIDWDHPDLASKIWINTDEIADNGIDDDANGFIDDVRGWDFGGWSGTADNNPMEDAPDHGTHVAGLAGGATNNSVGIASIGFNCKIMAIKTSRNDVRNDDGVALISYGYDGIKYAADNGAKIINCSWGGTGYSNFGNSIIEYAISKGALVVGAAGNENVSSIIYPAAYDGVLSVGASDINDRRSSFSNYGLNLDVMAPGSSIYGTWQNDRYITIQGTSMAAPIVAGLAGLVASVFPEYNPLQIAEQIRVNTDDIYGMNGGYIKKLGSGRINAFKTLSNNNSISVRATKIDIIEELDDNLLLPGEEIKISLGLTNYLSNTNNLSINLVTSSPYVELVKSNHTVGSLNSMQEIDLPENSFVFRVGQNAPTNEAVEFLLEYSDGSYSDFQWIKILINPTYRTQSGENVALTITSKGALAYNDFPDNELGEGFSFKNKPSVMFEGALIYGTSVSNLMDAARAGENQNEDFVQNIPISISTDGSISDYEGYTRFTDVENQIRTDLYSYTYSDEPNGNFIILKYIFKNITNKSISNFYAGLFYDFDIGSADNVNYDNQNNIGYTYEDNNTDTDYYGTALISDTKYGFYAINNGDSDSEEIEIYSDFTKEEKWRTISSGLEKTLSGPSDASMVVSAGPYEIGAGDSKIITFAVGAAENLDDLSSALVQSRVIYKNMITDTKEDAQLPEKFSLEQNYPNPFNPTTVIEYNIPANVNSEVSSVELTVFDLLGRKVKTLVNETKKPGNYKVEFKGNSITSGIYFYSIRVDEFYDVKKMVLVK